MSSIKTTKVVERLMLVSGVKTQVHLADILGISQAAVKQALSKGKIPEAWLYKVAYRTGRRIEWLQTGKGPEYLSESVAEAEARYGLTQSPALKGLLERRAELNESQRLIVDRAVEMMLSSDAGTRTLLLQVLDRVYEHHKVMRQSSDSASPKKEAGSA